MWKADFVLRHIITVDRTLSMRLQVDNPATEPITFEEALHTYFAVSDIHTTTVEGLAGVSYVSKVDPVGQHVQNDAPIHFNRETDRVYSDTPHTCIINDSAGGRRFKIEKKGSRTTVVWNPWIEKARRMEDFDDDRWPVMVCVETANTAGNRVVLQPGGQHAMTARLSLDAV
jgi:glucose-6-phosphate 1-epimerase